MKGFLRLTKNQFIFRHKNYSFLEEWNVPANPYGGQLTGQGGEGISGNIKSGRKLQTGISNLKNWHLPFHLILKTDDPGILRFRMGEENYSFLRNSYLRKAKKELSFYEARRVKLDEDLILAAFVSAPQAISCLMALKNSIGSITDQLILKMVLKLRPGNEKNIEEIRTNPFFFYKVGKIKPIIEQEVIRVAGDKTRHLLGTHEDVNIVKINEQRYLNSLFKTIKENWQNPFFNVSNLCVKMSSSKSRLYRMCKKITGISPIRLIKEYRLHRSLKSLKSQKNITEILYDSGFNSPSYFSRCFKNRFGMSPYFYQKNLV